MSGNPLSFALLTHETDGSYDLKKGTHLRWDFNEKIGVPKGGFCLYRIKSIGENISEDIAKLSN